MSAVSVCVCIFTCPSLNVTFLALTPEQYNARNESFYALTVWGFHINNISTEYGISPVIIVLAQNVYYLLKFLSLSSIDFIVFKFLTDPIVLLHM